MKSVSHLVFYSVVLYNHIELTTQFESSPDGEHIPGVTRESSTDTPRRFSSENQHPASYAVSSSHVRPHFPNSLVSSSTLAEAQFEYSQNGEPIFGVSRHRPPDTPRRFSQGIHHSMGSTVSSSHGRPHPSHSLANSPTLASPFTLAEPQFEYSRNGEPIQTISRHRLPDTPRRFHPGIHHSVRSTVIFPSASPYRPNSLDRSYALIESSLPLRSTSLYHILSIPSLSQLRVEELKYLRLVPHSNQNQRFRIRNYNFPRNAQIQVRKRNQVLVPMPTGEQTVLSTSDGTVFAILERNLTILRGIYNTGRGVQKRVKMNMYSGKIEDMTVDEKRETPLGVRHPISSSFQRMVDDRFCQQ